MKDITRIRIAKSSYDIELGAKKDLESYMRQLGLYAEDENVLEDIEIRITELLSERGVLTNDVIGIDDVLALREILGEPAVFSSEGDMALGDDSEVPADARRKLYRDIDHAVIGGVLVGVARYLGVGTAWVRFGFIILLIVSLGTASVAYILAWVLLPAAVTITEKLQAKGEPVTLAAIRRQSEIEITPTTERIDVRRKVAGIIVGVIGVLGAVAGVIATVAGAIAFYVTLQYEDDRYVYEPVVLGLLIAGGVLFTLFWVLVAYAGFKRTITKKLLIISVVTVVLGLGTFGTGVALFGHHAWQRQEAIEKSIIDRPVTLPASFEQSKRLRVDAQNVTVEYRVSNERRAYLTSVPGIKTEIKSVENTLDVTVQARNEDLYKAQPLLVIYGPKLDEIDTVRGRVSYYGTNTQTIKAETQTDRIMLRGSYSSVQIIVGEEGFVDASIANVIDAEVRLAAGGGVSLGNVATLKVDQSTTCGSNITSILNVGEVSTGKMVLNGKEQTAGSIKNTCGEIDFYDNDQYLTDEQYESF